LTVFRTETVAGVLPSGMHLTATGELHDVGSGTVTLTLFLAAAVCAAADDARWLRTGSRIALASALSVEVGLLVVGPSLGGLRERLLVAVACLWQLAFLVARRSVRRDPGKVGKSRPQLRPGDS
jgi:hypothetical protein